MPHSLERHKTREMERYSLLEHINCQPVFLASRKTGGMKNILGSRKTHLSTGASICNLSCCDVDVWQEVFLGEIFLRNWLSLLDLSTRLPIFLLPLSPLMRKFMSVIKTLAVAIRLVPKAANHGGGEWRVVPTHDINTHMLVCFDIVPYSISTMGACGTYTFTAGVLQSSGQDLGCSSSQCLSLSLGTKHMQLSLFLLSQRVAVAHLEEPRRRV